MPKRNVGFHNRICNLVPSNDTDRDWRYEDPLRPPDHPPFQLDQANEALDTVRGWRAGKTVLVP